MKFKSAEDDGVYGNVEGKGSAGGIIEIWGIGATAGRGLTEFIGVIGVIGDTGLIAILSKFPKDGVPGRIKVVFVLTAFLYNDPSRVIGEDIHDLTSVLWPLMWTGGGCVGE